MNPSLLRPLISHHTCGFCCCGRYRATVVVIIDIVEIKAAIQSKLVRARVPPKLLQKDDASLATHEHAHLQLHPR